MKPRHLIAIVAIGTGLVIIAPTAEKAGQADDRTEIAARPAEDATELRLEPASDGAEISHASFDGQTEKLEDANN